METKQIPCDHPDCIGHKRLERGVTGAVVNIDIVSELQEIADVKFHPECFKHCPSSIPLFSQHRLSLESIPLSLL